MKEGWEYKKLGDLGTFVRGGNFSKKDFVENGFPCIHYGQIHMKFGIETFKHISSVPAGMVKPDRCAHKGDLVIAITSEDDAGSCKCTAWMGDYDVYVGGHTAIYRHTMQPKYVSYYFMSPFFQKDKLEYTHGFKVVEISPKDIAKITIPVPPLSEQQSIVDYLDSAFAKIDAMKANAEKALNEAKALFQASLKEMLEPKEGWEESELKDIVDEKCPISYGIVQQGDHVEGGIPVVRPVDLNRKYITANGLKCTTESISSSYKRTILRGDEILLGVRGTTGIIGIATEELNGCNVNRGVVPLFFKDTICRDFIFYEMLSPAIQAVFAEKTTGATLKQINIKDLRTIVFSYPIIEIQQSIVETLDSLKSKVDRLQENYDKISQECDALKQAILRQVFE